MADNPYALRSRYAGHTPAVLRYRYRFAVANYDEAQLEDVRTWWRDLIDVRAVCLPERFAAWRILYVLAALAGVGLSAYLLLAVQSLPGAALALLATGVAFAALWLHPPALLYIDRHGLWVVRQVRTGHVPWPALQAIECDGGETVDHGSANRIHLIFKPGVEPAVVTHRFHVQRLKAGVSGKRVPGFKPVETPPSATAARWTLKVKPAGLAPREVAMLLRWALDAQGLPHNLPQVWLDPHAPDSPIDEHEFDDDVAY